MKSTEKLIKERIKQLEEENKYLDNELNNMTDYTEDLQQRIDKTIEYLQNNQLVFRLSSKQQIEKWFDKLYIDVIKILQGEDNGNN